MRISVLTLCATTLLVISWGTAMAESIKGRVGVTGRIGVIYPSNSDLGGVSQETDAGLIGGGGFIYGLDDKIALEFDITHGGFGSTATFPAPANKSTFETTNISFGGQYRFLNVPNSDLVPYLGGGLDILINGTNIPGADVDNVVGVHLSGGVDYFILKQFAVGGEFRGVVAPTADIINSSGAKIGNYDPMNISVIFGARYFFD